MTLIIRGLDEDYVVMLVAAVLICGSGSSCFSMDHKVRWWLPRCFMLASALFEVV